MIICLVSFIEIHLHAFGLKFKNKYELSTSLEDSYRWLKTFQRYNYHIPMAIDIFLGYATLATVFDGYAIFLDKPRSQVCPIDR